MTTIAYKDGVIAYDSRSTLGSIIVDDEYNKKIERDGVTFFIAGSVSDIDKLIESYLNKEYLSNEIDIGFECDAMIVDNGKVFDYTATPERCYLHPIQNHYAIGSGFQFALTAMDLGHSAKQAVKIASQRDTCTGGKIREYKIKLDKNV